MDTANVLLYICVLLAAYLIQFIIYGLWYKTHQRSNMGYLNFVGRLFGHFVYCIFHFPSMFLKKTTPEMPAIPYYWMAAVIFPLMLPSILLSSDSWIYRGAVFVFAQIACWQAFLNDEKTEVSKLTDQWIRYLTVQKETVSPPEPKQRVRLSDHEIRINRIFAALLILTAILIFGVMNFTFFSNQRCNVAFLILMALFVLEFICFMLCSKRDRDEARQYIGNTISAAKRNIENRMELHPGITVDPALKLWEEQAARMCQILGIRQICILTEQSCTTDMRGCAAQCVMTDQGVWAAVLSQRMIGRWYTMYSEEKVFDMVRFILGHELVHIRFRDRKRMGYVLRLSLSLLLTAILLDAGYVAGVYLMEKDPVSGFLLLLLSFVLGLLSLRSFCSRQYWKRVSEYRADRISARICGAKQKNIQDALLCSEEQPISTGKKRKKGFHPETKDRLHELERGRSWSKFDYVRYAVRN